MTRRFLALPKTDDEKITLGTIFKADILLWFFGVALAMLIWFVLSLIVRSALPAEREDDSTVALQHIGGGIIHYALLTGASIVATLAKPDNVKTLSAILVPIAATVIFTGGFNLLLAINLDLQFTPLVLLLHMVAVLAIARLIEYRNLCSLLETPRLTRPALASYFIVIALVIALTSSLIYIYAFAPLIAVL